MRRKLEFAVVWLLVKSIGWLPRPVARNVGAGIGWTAFVGLPRLRKVGMRNLALAFPGKSIGQRKQMLRALYRNLGWQLAEFCQMPHYSLAYANRFIRYDGLENYLEARHRGKGVLVVTGHIGAWELSSFYHSLVGYPMSMVIRRLDNPYLDRFVNRIRCLHGNRVLHKDEFARAIFASVRAGETVGVLMDTNMTPPQGVFVDLFGHAACTAAGVARVAQRTGAAVVPGYLTWESKENRYVLHFLKPLELVNTGNEEQDTIANTQLFTKSLEDIIRRYPEQWLWVHRRWKTRPGNEASLY